ncbi:MAG: mobile mystery protein B [Cytophagia bacterium]|nr:mobile mystery protein B [Cytophagia bacterium]
MGLELEYIDGQTPLEDEEKEGLKLKTISTHGELDEHEQLNIEKAVEWLMGKKLKPTQILSEKFIVNLHKRMFKDMWRWAGEFRKTEKNIGIPWISIPIELRQLTDDTQFWIDNHTYSPEEIAIRFKHRLVRIHCFANGNGRHSRMMADLILESIFGKEPFSWNASKNLSEEQLRKQYIKAVKEADDGNIAPLLKFAME